MGKYDNLQEIKMYDFVYYVNTLEHIDEALYWVNNVLPLFICNLTHYPL